MDEDITLPPNKTYAFSSRLVIIVSLLLIAALISPYPTLLPWFGFFVAAYSTMANDSIQTLGTFLASHRETAWWIVWLVFGSIMLAVLCYGWFSNGHELGFGRLAKIPVPKQLGLIEVTAPIALLALTQLKIPVSTTFLILSIFSNDVVINKMLVKSCLGYLVAFIAALCLWGTAKYLFQAEESRPYNKAPWRVAQWLAASTLWAYWLMHDTANMVVFLPRQFNVNELIIVLTVVFVLFGFIMYQRGAGIQEIVTEKQNSDDLRAATIIDIIFALTLTVFKHASSIPMSTTWVFLGVLAGRELVLRANGMALKIIINDVGKASLGIVVSLLLVSLSHIL